MTFKEWWSENGTRNGYEHDFAMKVWNAALDECRLAVLDQGREASEAAKAKDATDYVAGYQDACVDCDEELKELVAQ